MQVLAVLLALCVISFAVVETLTACAVRQVMRRS